MKRLFHISLMLFVLVSVNAQAQTKTVKKLDPAPVKKESVTEVETRLIDSLLESKTFPEKSDFIAKEDEKFLEAKKNGVKAEKPESKASLVNMMMGTVLVIGLILALTVVMKFLQGRQGGGILGVGKLKIIAQQFVGMRSKIAIVEAYGKKYMVGISPDRIQLLADLDFFDANENAEKDALGAVVENFSPVKSSQAVMENHTEESSKSKAADRIKEKLRNLRRPGTGR